MEYMTTEEATEKWGIKIRQVQALCDNGQIENATWLVQISVIPKVIAKQNRAHKPDMFV